MRILLSAGLLVLCASPASGQRSLRDLGTFPVQLAIGATPTVVQVTWQPVARSSAYDVERCEGAGLTTCSVKAHLLTSQPLKLDDQVFKEGTYLYRVTALGMNQLPMAQGQVGFQYTEPPTAVVIPPPTGTITPTPAGPAQLTATSPVPGQIHLSWSLVQNAIGYHVLRSVVGYAGEQELPPPGTDPNGNTGYRYINAPVDFRWTYSYRVYATVKPAGVEIQSAWSPSATAKSLPFVQVSGLTYSLMPSTKTPGRLDLTIRWNAVAGAEKYIVWDKTYNVLLREVPGAVYVETGYSPHTHFTACVGVQYPYNVRQPATEPCIDIKM